MKLLLVNLLVPLLAFPSQKQCNNPLGISDPTIIKDSQITVTSQHHSVVGGNQARLNTGNAWCTNIEPWKTNHHITINFKKTYSITKIRLQGMPTSCDGLACPEGYTRWLQVRTSKNGENWETYKNGDDSLKEKFRDYPRFRFFKETMIQGNNRSNIQGIDINFNPPLTFSHFIRVIPLDYVQGPACLRFEAFGCETPENSVVSVSQIQKGKIEQLSTAIVDGNEASYLGSVKLTENRSPIIQLQPQLLDNKNMDNTKLYALVQTASGRALRRLTRIQDRQFENVFELDLTGTRKVIEIVSGEQVRSYSWLSLNQNTWRTPVISPTTATVTTTEYTIINQNEINNPDKSPEISKKSESSKVSKFDEFDKIDKIEKTLPNDKTGKNIEDKITVMNKSESILDNLKHFFQNKSTIAMIVIVALAVLFSLFCAYLVVAVKARKNRYKHDASAKITFLRSDSSFEDEFGFTLLPTNSEHIVKPKGQTSPIDSGYQKTENSTSDDANSRASDELLPKEQRSSPKDGIGFINSFVEASLSANVGNIRGIAGNPLPQTPRSFVPSMGVQSTLSRSVSQQTGSYPNNIQRCASRVSKVSSFGTSGIGSSIQESVKIMNCPVIDGSRLKIIDEIGKGEFGRVLLCQFDHPEHKLVAMKQLTLVSECVLRDFEREIEIMQKIKCATLDCPYIVKLIGTCHTGINGMNHSGMITEYHEHGDLHGFLQKNDEITPDCLWHIAGQVCAGMLELSKHSIVHRDLAARNIMVGKKIQIADPKNKSCSYKIAIGDFGMSRDTFTESYYKISGRAILPIRWMAWECVLNGTFSSASDVWAFGVTVWEIFSLCRAHPFAGHSDEEIIRNFYRFLSDFGVNDGIGSRLKLEKPLGLDETTWMILEECWLKEKDDRPSFRDLAKVFRV